MTKKMLHAKQTIFLSEEQVNPMATSKNFFDPDKTDNHSANSLNGSLYNFPIISILQLLEMDRSDCRLSLVHPEGKGFLEFRNGILLDAQCGGRSGDHAVIQILSWECADIDFLPASEPVKVSVAQSLKFLIFQYLTVKDELGNEGIHKPSIQQVIGYHGVKHGAASARPKGSEDVLILPPYGKGPAKAQSPILSRESASAVSQVASQSFSISEALIKDVDLSPLSQILGFVGVCMVDSQACTVLAKLGEGQVDLAREAAGEIEAYQSHLHQIEDMTIEESIEEILICLKNVYHLIRPVPGMTQVFICLILDRTLANLGFALFELRAFCKDLHLTIPT